MKGKGKYILIIRVVGNDRKLFFVIAESPNSIDNFRFWEKPVTLPETECPDTNVYDMRLTSHEDGLIYDFFVVSGFHLLCILRYPHVCSIFDPRQIIVLLREYSCGWISFYRIVGNN